MKRRCNSFIKTPDDLVTPYAQTRAGFVALALEKNRMGTPYVEEAKALKVAASKAKQPKELLNLTELQPALLTASGVSDKATNHLADEDKKEAIKGFIQNFLEPAGNDFIDELVYRFLLTKGDSLGGSMRNVAGKLGEMKFIRALISSLWIRGRSFRWRDRKTDRWIDGTEKDLDIESNANALSWEVQSKKRVLIMNITVPIVKKNVDLSLLICSESDVAKGKKSAYYFPEKYIALGELKGGIDPAGADEHWKTANSALNRIRISFASKKASPYTFFIGAAIEKAMANEIFKQLKSGELNCAGNLTNEDHLYNICGWLTDL
ncbi:MAG: AvaI/BsoBI family type II restriction endonuclease [Candidatus Brocadiales bacterium]